MAGTTMSEKTFWKRFNESLDNQKRLISSTEYLDWLYEFTIRYPNFTDTDWLYINDPNMSENDHRQVKLLTDFFTAIDQYHSDNLLEGNTEAYATWYYIKYKDVYFAIGIRVGQGAENFVTRYENYEVMVPKHFVEFEAIMQNKQDDKLAEKNEALQKLENEIKHLCSLGIPKSAIDQVIKQAFEKKNKE